MIIAVTNLKGGSGKSTISINLGVALAQRGHSTCILDTDLEQRSSMKWSADRTENGPHIAVYGVEVNQLPKETKALSQHHDIIIIDGAPKLEEHGEIIMVVSDIVIIPMKASILDFRSTEEFVKSFRKVKSLKQMQDMPLQGCLVINDAEERTLAYKDVKAAVEQLDEGLFFTIPHLVAFKDAIQNGEGVTEHDNGRAKEAFNEFVDRVENLLKLESSLV